jgi:competence protein ComEA
MKVKKIKNLIICIGCLAAAFSSAITYMKPKTVEKPEDFIVFYDIKKTGGSVQNESEMYNDGKISINSATLEELMTLPRIGEVKAKAIIAYREEYGAFVSIEELTEVRGIGEVTLEKLRDLIKL